MTTDRPIVLLTPAGNPVRHGGSGTAYANYGCRCGPCTEANRVRVARRRAEWSPEAEGLVHGSRSTYTNYGCRCAECKNANRVGSADYYARKKVG